MNVHQMNTNHPDAHPRSHHGVMFSPCFAVIFFALAVGHADGQDESPAGRTSASYQLTYESSGTGGGRVASTSYALDSATGDSGTSAVAGAYSLRSGLTGMAFDAKNIILISPSTTLDELAEMQFAARLVLDDSSLLELPAGALSWRVAVGPIESISATGLVKAAAVYEDTPATVAADDGIFSAKAVLTVRSVDDDNFGSYALDGLPDDWQVRHFGFDNPAAAPGNDPTSKGQNNLFCFLAGLDPLDPADVFRMVSLNPPAPDTFRFAFLPVIPDRSYTIEFCDDLQSGNWWTLTDCEVSEEEGRRIVTDRSPPDSRRCYRVRIARP